MGNDAHYDSDEYRLPEGMRRTHYDADTGVYTYTDADGSEWEGAPGSRYGQLRRAGTTPLTLSSSPPHVSREEVETEAAVRRNDQESWRAFFPFLALVGAVLLLVIWLTRGGGASFPEANPDAPSFVASKGKPAAACGDDARPHAVEKGESCWQIARDLETSVEEILRRNPALECDRLRIGAEICVPAAG